MGAHAVCRGLALYGLPAGRLTWEKRMIAVIQCAGSKQEGAGHFVSETGTPICFVAHPEKAPHSEPFSFARPDDLAPTGRTWREAILAYNAKPDNPLHLYPAWELYEPVAYRRLVTHLGGENVFILSAGWGLVRSDFRLPKYDITFSAAVKKVRPWSYRRKTDVYGDFNQLPQTSVDPIFFFGGHDYTRLFCQLTRRAQAPRTVYYNSADPPRAPGCRLQRFLTAKRTNWHYDCVEWFVSAGCGRR